MILQSLENSLLIMKTKDELKQLKAKNDILMHTEKTYTVTEIATELGVSSAKVLNQILSRDAIFSL